jgi:hypothetical protein
MDFFIVMVLSFHFGVTLGAGEIPSRSGRNLPDSEHLVSGRPFPGAD